MKDGGGANAGRLGSGDTLLRERCGDEKYLFSTGYLSSIVFLALSWENDSLGGGFSFPKASLLLQSCLVFFSLLSPRFRLFKDCCPAKIGESLIVLCIGGLSSISGGDGGLGRLLKSSKLLEYYQLNTATYLWIYPKSLSRVEYRCLHHCFVFRVLDRGSPSTF